MFCGNVVARKSFSTDAFVGMYSMILDIIFYLIDLDDLCIIYLTRFVCDGDRLYTRGAVHIFPYPMSP